MKSNKPIPVPEPEDESSDDDDDMDMIHLKNQKDDQEECEW